MLVSYIEPINTTNVDALGTLNILEATAIFAPDAKFYTAIFEIFGYTPDYPIDENSKCCRFHPKLLANLNV